jgi:hypothetical protein
MRFLPVLLVLIISGAAVAADARVDHVDIVGKGLYRVETGERTPEAGLPAGSVASPVTFTNLEKDLLLLSLECQCSCSCSFASIL